MDLWLIILIAIVCAVVVCAVCCCCCCCYCLCCGGRERRKIHDVEKGEMRVVHHSVEADSSNEEIEETDGPSRNQNARQNFSYMHDKGEMRIVHHSVETDSSNEEIEETDGPSRNWNVRQNFNYMYDEGKVVERAHHENGTLLWTDQGKVKIINVFFLMYSHQEPIKNVWVPARFFMDS